MALADRAFLALGDSYTMGEAVPPPERFPNQLAKALRIPEPDIVAKTGWTTDELEWAVRQANLKGPFDLITLLIGVNDQFRGRTIEAYGEAFDVLLERAVGLAGGHAARVVVVSIPDWSVTPFAATRDRNKISAEIDRFNDVNREQAVRAGARYADVTPISRRAAEEPGLITADRLHPSGRMYAEWLSVILPEAEKALGIRS